MLRFAKIFATIALVCAVAQSVEIQSFSKEYFVDHADQYVLSRKIAFANHSFIYMTCDKTSMPHEVHCHMTMEVPTGSSKHCQVNLVEPETREITLTDPMMIKRMGDKVVFEWFSMDKVNGYHHQYRKVSVISVDKCTVVHLDFPIDKVDWPNYQVVVYHNSFDVYVTSKMLCGEYEQCIIRYNYDGERVGNPIHFPSKLANVYSMVVNWFNPEKGAFFAGVEWKVDNGVIHATHVNHTGFETDLFTFPIKDASMMKFIRGSNYYEYYSICYMVKIDDTKAHCMQYDVMGHKMMDTMVEMEKEHKMINVFNQRQGGLIFVYRGCNGSPDCTTVHVKMVHTDGHVVKHVEIPGVEYQCVSPSRELIVDHMENENEHCFYFACAHKQTTGKMSFKYVSKCMDKKTYF